MNPNRIAAEQGLETACSCRLPSPTSTVTESFTVPNASTTTVGVRYLRIVQTTETRTFTSTTTVRAGVTGGVSATASSSTDAVSSSTNESTLADPVGNTIATSATTDADAASSSPEITDIPIITIPVGGNATATVPAGAAVVTALPFSCDDDDVDRSVDQVVGGLRLGYNVYCNTGFTQDRVGRPVSTNTTVEDATSCAAQCSLLNAQGQSDACQSALFTPSNDGSGSCTLYAADDDGTNVVTTPAPGSVAIVHTGTFANGDECAALNVNSVSIDTSAVVASITSGGVVVETPGLITQSSGGGVFETYVSANSTDPAGNVHWSWYQISASSASWFAVYGSSWACSATITRTIEQPATTIVGGTTITSVIVTTIIGNGYTTIISGDSTTTIGGGGGIGGPSLVPATTTGEGGMTTIFSTAVVASTGTDGLVTPTPAPGGQGNVTVVEVFSTFFSTGSEGVIAPSTSLSLNVSSSVSEEVIVSSTATTLTIFGANSTYFFAGGNGVITPTVTPILETTVSSGATTITISGFNATAVSTGDSGIIPPVSMAISSTTSEEEEEWDTSGAYGPPRKTSTIVVASSKVTTVTSIGASEIVTTAIGGGNVTVIVSTATANSNGGAGVIPPGGTLVVTETVNTTLPVPTTETTSTGGVSNFTTRFETGVTVSTGAPGVIPPGPTNATSLAPFVGTTTSGDRFGSFSRSSTSTGNVTASSGFATPSSNSSVAIETPSANTTLTLTVPLSTGFTSTIEVQVNSSAPVTSAPSVTSTASFNESSSIFSGSTNGEDRTGSFSRPRSSSIVTPPTTPLPKSTPGTLVVTATTNITLSLPSGNVTLIPPTTRPFDNTTTTPFPIPTGNITTETFVSINYSTVPSFSTGNLSTIFPPTSTNISITVETTPPASVTLPPVSLNLTTSVFNGSTTSGDRTGTFSRSRYSSVILSTGTSTATTTPPPFPTGNSTVPLVPTAPTTSACPSPSEFSYITREVVITTTIVETVPISNCPSSSTAPSGLNGTLTSSLDETLPTDEPDLPSGPIASLTASLTASDSAPAASNLTHVVSDILSAVSSVVADITAPATSDVEATASPISRFRRIGTLASQEQINAACADTGNLILSPNLGIQADNITEGWFISSDFDPSITVSSVSTANGTIARFSFAFAGDVAQLTQPLTLCPGTKYTISGLARQDDTRSGCTVQHRIGPNVVFTASPLTSWTQNSAAFTAGPGTEGASQDLTMVLSCAGRGGAPIGANDAGYMVGEVGAVSVTAV
ncbi:hypothetical protein G6514_008502 [Epicoccum nigrum]|nr:hypothetical protein G6514_008502 [Epicoccum nigrum]